MISLLRRAKRKMLTRLDPDAKLLRQVQPYTLSAPETLKNLKRLAMLVDQHNIEGDFVQCGTYRGRSAAALATALTPQRRLWLYDSFEGMPDTKPVDGGRRAIHTVQEDLNAGGRGLQVVLSGLIVPWFLGMLSTKFVEFTVWSLSVKCKCTG